LNAAVASYSYTVGPAGNRLSAAESSGRTLAWSYDGTYRLVDEAISLDPHSQNGSVGYSLDPVGNRLSQASSVPGISSGNFIFDANDRLGAESYDNNGNTLASAGRTFAYDFENRLKSMNGGVVTLLYDADGIRVAKTVGGSTTRYLVDDLNPTGYSQVVEEVVNGVVQRVYSYGSQRISQNQFVNATWVSTFYGYDGSDSVRSLTDSGGTVTDTYSYDAWGNLSSSTGATPNVYLYRGEQYDPDLGSYFFRARWLNPLTGRFLTRDTDPGQIKAPITQNKYLYGNADPVNNDDPSGHGNGTSYALLLSSLILKVAPIAEATGLYVRGQLSLGAVSIMRAGYWWDTLFESDPIRAFRMSRPESLSMLLQLPRIDGHRPCEQL
jgi:RHS repeat-associated protein